MVSPLLADPHYVVKDPAGAVSNVELRLFSSGKPAINRIGRSIQRINRAGRHIETGPSYNRRYEWPIRAVVFADDKARLQILEMLLSTGTRTHLILEDRMRTIPFESAPQKQGIAGTGFTIDTFTMGFAQYAVNFILDANPVEFLDKGTDQDRYLINGTFTEIPGISV
mgnify:FL=1